MSLHEFWPHLDYEVRMLIFAARRLSRYPDYRLMATGHPDKHEHDAILESFLIHVRLLDEFFRTTKTRGYEDTDMRAVDIANGFVLSGPRWKGI